MAGKSPRNKTIELKEEERVRFEKELSFFQNKLSLSNIKNKVFNANIIESIDFFPDNSVNLLIADPPYNMEKRFADMSFKEKTNEEYIEYLDSWLGKTPRILTEDASVYVCGDWKTSHAIYEVLSRYFIVRNRITWQREKGRGSNTNWKNSSEDIWFATVSSKYVFNASAVKLRKKVIAPYKENGKPKDWEDTSEGNFRNTYSSNFWYDITVPYWSMAENTAHPTQKSEKLLAKLILASSNENALVFDPFLGSGTTAVVAKKLNRFFVGAEINKEYCLLALKRLNEANENKRIQGYEKGVFWERNTPNKDL